MYEFDDYVDDIADFGEYDDDEDEDGVQRDEYDEYGDKIDQGGFNFESTAWVQPKAV